MANANPPPFTPLTDPSANAKEDLLREVRRLDDLRHAFERRIDEVSKLESVRITELIHMMGSHQKELTAAESKRMDAVIGQLSGQLASLTDRLRDQIEAVAKIQNQGVGRDQLADPQMALLLAEMRGLRQGAAEGKGSAAGQSQMWIIGVGVVGMLIGIAGVIFALVRLLGESGAK